MQKNRLSVWEVAQKMNVSEQFVRVGLQQNKFPWGFSVKMSTKWTYYIDKERFELWKSGKI